MKEICLKKWALKHLPGIFELLDHERKMAKKLTALDRVGRYLIQDTILTLSAFTLQPLQRTLTMKEMASTEYAMQVSRSTKTRSDNG
jgi:hypothetical protein